MRRRNVADKQCPPAWPQRRGRVRADPAATPETGLHSVLRVRGFGRYLSAYAAAVIADQLWFVTLGWAASRLGSPVQTSLVMAAASVPRAALLLIGGAVADRHGPAWVVGRAQMVRIMVAVGAAAVALARPSNMVLLVAVAVAFGLADALYLPAAAALPPLLVARDRLPAAQGLVQTMQRAMTTAGAPVGGMLVALSGTPLAWAACGMLCLVSAAAFLRLPTSPMPAVEPEDHPGMWRQVAEGLVYVRSVPILWMLLTILTALNFALNAAISVGLPLASRSWGWGSPGFGWTIGACGAGATLGALSLSRGRPRQAPAATALVWICVDAACLAGLGLTRQLAVAAAVMCVAGLAGGSASVLLAGLIQGNIEPRYMGRVMSLIAFSSFGLTPVSYTVFGVAASTVGLRGAFLAAGALVFLPCVAGLATKLVRSARLVPGGDPATQLTAKDSDNHRHPAPSGPGTQRPEQQQTQKR
jgi:MFS family permease